MPIMKQYSKMNDNIVQVIGVFACLTIVIAVWMHIAFNFKPKKPLKDLRTPGIALQLVKSAKEFIGIAGDKDDLNRTIIQKSLKADYFFIAAYWLLFANMGVLLASRNITGAIWLGIAVGVCATAAAIFDVMENIHISNVLPLTLTEKDDSLIRSIRNVSLYKWAFLFITNLLIAPIFLWRDDWIVWSGYLFILGAFIGFIGLIYNPAIEWASALMGVCIILISGIFTCCSGKFLMKF